ncbi:hypothetical protein [Xanthobacter agilis]|uniref:Transposase n=1 Tax=Xanthobacter agilis TaxID=47492 RepID=A0ABU0LB20_XANAG|nr:hypothetical protein [Xanthobacter agilis]MDQ0504337.1 hypothetical protein [Xanthobacter agilis]
MNCVCAIFSREPEAPLRECALKKERAGRERGYAVQLHDEVGHLVAVHITLQHAVVETKLPGPTRKNRGTDIDEAIVRRSTVAVCVNAPEQPSAATSLALEHATVDRNTRVHDR